MSKVRVQSFAVSLDGYGAGPNQSLEHPLGVNGPDLMEWFFHTRIWRGMQGESGGETGIDNGLAERGMSGIGAWILGRNMFGPIRGAWPDESWRGWWGEEPPYHTPVFVLTRYARAPLRMAGGTEFRFVTDGVQTVREYLRAGLIDEMHLAVRPILLGRGEALWHDIDLRALGYEIAEEVDGERATHVFIRKV
jgi:dihydrofolate reductase